MVHTAIDIDIVNISIKEDRLRKEFTNIQSLADSIAQFGLMNPIHVKKEDDHYCLIAGERRTKAFALLGRETIPAFVLESSEINSRIYEIIENIDREDFSWQERVNALEELTKLVQSERPKGKELSLNKMSEKIGISSGGVSMGLNLAKALKEVPDIFQGCKTQAQAMKALKKYEIDETMAELALRKKDTNFGVEATSMYFKGDCNVLIDKLPDRSVHALISDPIYGIDVFSQRFTNKDLPAKSYSDQYDDSLDNFSKVLETLIIKASKKLKEDAFVLMFCAYENSQWLIDQWKAQGFNMDVIPGVWARGSNTARTNAPTMYFNRCYDLFVYGTRGKYTLAKQGTTNVIQIAGVNTGDRIHPSQKPVALLEELILRSCLPGFVVLDPMAGSGTTLVAAIKRGCIPIGFDLDADNLYYNNAILRLTKALELKHSGNADHIGDY